MIPSSAQRVPRRTAEHVNRAIRDRTKENLKRYLMASPRVIEARLAELDREWDIERILEAQAAGATLLSLMLAALGRKRWLIVSAAVGGFLLQHAIVGWCPPLPILRRTGFRTAEEIDEERYALKMLRGDFGATAQRGDIDKLLAAVDHSLH